jgi:hypothetical protein
MEIVMHDAYHPPLRLNLKGLMASAAAAAAPSILVGPLVVFFAPIIFVIALLHGLVLGLPAYLLLGRWRRISAWHAALGGFLIGGLPTATVIVASIGNAGGDLSILDSLAVSILILGAFGMLAGVVFHWVVRRPAGDE